MSTSESALTSGSTSRDFEVRGPAVPRSEQILTDDALAFVAELQRRFGRPPGRAAGPPRRAAQRGRPNRPAGLPSRHRARAPRRLDRRGGTADLVDRRVEITGPPEPKMAINALNSGAKVWLADLEDANTPHWSNVDRRAGHALRRRSVVDWSTPPRKARQYRLAPDRPLAVIVPRPRGWHFDERHLLVDGAPTVGALVDFGLYFFHNAAELLDRGSGPYFYLPKMESHLEARLWNDVFAFAEQHLGIEHGTIRATVLIETIPAAFEMDEILYELTGLRLRAERRPVGLPVQRDQVLPRRRPAVRAARPRRGHHDGTDDARLHRPAGGDLSPPGRLRHGRDGGVHSQPPRRRGEPTGDGEGAARTRNGRPGTGSTGPGWPIPTWCRSAGRCSTGCWANGRTNSTGVATRSR